jgi:predicted RNA-binding Zn-ribbon protein involved in translation (DUF1610 family)
MTAKAGEIARETTTYSCQNCGQEIPVSNGCPIPDCPSCGNESFQTGSRTLQNQPAAAAPSGFANFP